jgi:Lamin Tail Domain
VREVLGTAVDEFVIGRLLPMLQGALPGGGPAEQWLEEAALPSLLGVREFVLGRVDSLVGGSVDGDLSGFLNELRTALGVLGGKVVVRNLLVLQWILEDHVRTTVAPQLRTLAGVITTGPLPPELSQALAAWRQTATQLTPPFGVDPVLVASASRKLFGGLVALAADVLEVEPASRRTRRRVVQAEAVRVADLTVDYGSSDEVLALVRSVMDCNGLPDVGAAAEFGVLQVQTLVDQVVVAVTGAAPLLQRFFEEISAPALQLLADGFGEFVSGLERAKQQAVIVVRVLDRIIREAAEDVAEAARRLSDHLDELRRLLRSSDVRAQTLERIRTGARANAVSIGGDGAGVIFDGVWAVAAFIVDPALDVLGAAAGVLSQILEDVASGADAVAALSAALSERVVEAMVGTDLRDLADFLGVDDLARWVSDVVTGGAVHAELAAAGAARRDERQAESRHTTAEQSRTDARADRRSAELRLAGVSRTRIRPRIMEPAVLRGGLPVVHEGTVTLRVQLPGGDARLLGAGEGRRLDVRLNGRVLKLTLAHLHVALVRCELVRPLTSADGLRPGINVVECAVLAGDRALVDRVAFAWVPGVRPPSKGLAVDMARSRLNVRGNDHLAPEEEFVCLVNEGSEAVDLTGWRISDRAGHTFVFPSGRLAPGGRLQLHTGRGTDSATRRFWGRRAAVWNNPWEAVVLVAPSGSVRAVAAPGGAR